MQAKSTDDGSCGIGIGDWDWDWDWRLASVVSEIVADYQKGNC